jgi:polyhydroxyalkanoate synthase
MTAAPPNSRRAEKTRSAENTASAPTPDNAKWASPKKANPKKAGPKKAAAQKTGRKKTGSQNLKKNSKKNPKNKESRSEKGTPKQNRAAIKLPAKKPSGQRRNDTGHPPASTATGAAFDKERAPDDGGEDAARGPSQATSGAKRFDGAALAGNLAKLAIHSQYLLADFLKRNAKKNDPKGDFTAADPLGIRSMLFELLSTMAAHPQKLFATQLDLWRDYARLWQSTTARLMGRKSEPVITPERGDRRFRDPAWENNLVFDFIKQSYLITARRLNSFAQEIDESDPHEKQKAEFYIRQFADALSPSNFVLTNPQVLSATLDSNGENLLRGFENLLKDIERGQGDLLVSQTDMNAFEVGRNLALTPGKVVYRSELFELIQYVPATETVYRRPLLIFPPWINKFYILDMRPDNSFVRWAVAQGYTVFIVSWVNPDPRLARKTFEDYMKDGILNAIDAVREATDEERVNVLGYCVAGTLLAATLGTLAVKGDDRVASATLLATQVDFSEAGELSVFVDDYQLKALDERMQAAGGILPARNMALTFNMLRANDLIWSYVVNNYLLGKPPLPFDLLYWNSDATRLPRALHLYYLRSCYQENALARGTMTLGGITPDLSLVKTPVFVQASIDDHIAPSRSVYKATQLFGGPVHFMLAASGHIAGVINPPAAGKYGYWTFDGKDGDGDHAAYPASLPASLDAWRAQASEQAGSWWPEWDRWLLQHSGEKIPARHPGDGRLAIIEDAPGSYVRVRS